LDLRQSNISIVPELAGHAWPVFAGSRFLSWVTPSPKTGVNLNGKEIGMTALPNVKIETKSATKTKPKGSAAHANMQAGVNVAQDKKLTVLEKGTSELMSSYSALVESERVTRDSSHHFAKVFFGVCNKYLDDPEFKEAMDARIKECGLKPAKEGANKFLNVGKALFGKREPKTHNGKPVVDKETKQPKMVWNHDRSVEKYCYVIEVAVHLEYTSDDLFAALQKGGTIKVNGETVDATIIGLAGARKHLPTAKDGAAKRTEQLNEARKKDGEKLASSLKPLIQFPLEVPHKVKFDRNGFYMVVARVENGVIHILGNSGIPENEVIRLVKDKEKDFKLNETLKSYEYQVKGA
jgi:hypothetical protein